MSLKYFHVLYIIFSLYLFLEFGKERLQNPPRFNVIVYCNRTFYNLYIEFVLFSFILKVLCGKRHRVWLRFLPWKCIFNIFISLLWCLGKEFGGKGSTGVS